ncbi:MAG: hypothetical protein ABSD67_26075 [Terracidiphilus sp.]|jgi:hypothetical protein
MDREHEIQTIDEMARGRSVKSTRFSLEMKRLFSIETLAAKKLVRAVLPALLYLGLSALIGLSSACKHKVAKQETPHNVPAPPPADIEHTVLAATTIIPSNKMCKGLSGDAEAQCLCPHPLQFTLKSQPGSPDDAFSTDIDIKKSAWPMYRVRIFSVDDIDRVSGVVAIPNEENSLNIAESMDFDPSSVILSSSTPKDEFKLNVATVAQLRLKCIDQEH